MAVDDEYTKSLLHFNGDQDSHVFTDESGKTWSINATEALIDQGRKKFGTGAGHFDGFADYISTPDSADFDFDGDFTIDFWLLPSYLPDGNTWQGIISACKTSAYAWEVYLNNYKVIFSHDNVAEYILNQTLENGHDYHVAIVRSGTTLKGYINGVEKVSGTLTGVVNTGGDGLVIGRIFTDQGSYWYNGLIDELRISKGIARWTSGFTPPTSEYVSAGLDTAVEVGTGIRAEMVGELPYTDSIVGISGVKAAMAGTFEIAESMAAEAGILADFEGFNWTEFLRVYRERLNTRYVLTLSNGILDDVILPISSFQTRLRTGEPTFLEVVVPGNDQYAEIAARDDGDLILTMQYLVGDVVAHSEEICRVDLESIRLDEGVSSTSVSLSGHRTVTYSPKTIQLAGVSYRSLYDGKRHVRCSPDLYLRPGDTCLDGDDTFTAGVITWTANPSNMMMEIEEAETLTEPETETEPDDTITSDEYELTGPGVILWNPDAWYTEGLGWGGSETEGSTRVMSIVWITQWSVTPVDPDMPAVATVARGIVSPVLCVPNGGNGAYSLGDPGNGCTLTISADYVDANGITQTLYKSVTFSP